MIRYDLKGYFGIGYTSQGYDFYFDLEDYERIKNHTWWIDKQGYVRTEVRQNGKRTHIKMHNFVMNFHPTKNNMVDHIHRNKRDNRKSELRIVTKQQNSLNGKLQSNNTSGVKGVSYNKNNFWEMYIKVNGQRIYLGISHDKDEAIKIRLQAEKYYFGDFAPQKHLFKKYGVL